MLGQSESEIRLAWDAAGAAMETDQSDVRRGDEESHLALVSEWERNLAAEQEKWRCWALQRELESCMFWVCFLGELKLVLRGSSANTDMIQSRRDDWTS